MTGQYGEKKHMGNEKELQWHGKTQMKNKKQVPRDYVWKVDQMRRIQADGIGWGWEMDVGLLRQNKENICPTQGKQRNYKSNRCQCLIIR